jgi:AraC-like DNA-binding protein
MRNSKHVVQFKSDQAPVGVMSALLQGVGELGYDTGAVLSQAGVIGTASELLSEGAKRISLPAFADICHTCNNILRDHITRHHDCISMTDDQFNMCCRCVIHAANLEEAIELTATFFRMFEGRIGTVKLEVVGEQARLHFNRQRHTMNHADYLVQIYGFAVQQRLYGWLIDDRISFLSTHLIHPRPSSDSILPGLFTDYEVSFSQSSNYFCFDRSYLSQPVVRTQKELHQIGELFPYDLMLSGYRRKTLAERVQQVMIDYYSKHSQLPECAHLARLFQLTEHTMRRRLTEENTAYSKIRRQCQIAIIGDYLRRSELTINEIATRSGFSDAGTFRRAFKQWTGRSPSDYRRVLELQ